jgi:hypothetical protein
VTASTSTNRSRGCASPSTRPRRLADDQLRRNLGGRLGGAGASGVNDRGGITLSEGDLNPERIQIDATSSLFAGYDPHHTQGDRLSDVTGIVSYSFNSYEVLVTEAVTVTEDVTVSHEVTGLEGDRDHLTIASYNVENLDPGDSAAKFDLLAGNIVYNLGAPDIIALQEVQDGNGLNGSDPLSAWSPRRC